MESSGNHLNQFVVYLVIFFVVFTFGYAKMIISDRIHSCLSGCRRCKGAAGHQGMYHFDVEQQCPY